MERVQTMPGQRIVNRIVRGLLRTPLLCRLLGRRLVTLHVVGRKTGRRYTVPVAYTRDGDALLVGTPFGWGRNLRTGEQITLRYKGKLRAADVVVHSDEPAVVTVYATMAADNHNFAKFNKIRLDEGGRPDPDDLHAAWVDGARAARLIVREPLSATAATASAGRSSRADRPPSTGRAAR